MPRDRNHSLEVTQLACVLPPTTTCHNPADVPTPNRLGLTLGVKVFRHNCQPQFLREAEMKVGGCGAETDSSQTLPS